MITKHEAAQRFAEIMLNKLENPLLVQTNERVAIISENAFKLADAMQAEAEKREDKMRPKALLTKDKDGKCLHFNHEFGHKKCMDCGASLEEWQPDWSQAPDEAKYWAMDKDGSANFFKNKPEITNGNGWDFGGVMQSQNSHAYTGNWENSLRKRPQ